MKAWKKWHPRLVEHKAPVKEVQIEGVADEYPVYRIKPEDLREWIKTLPKDWPEMFSNVMGQVTYDGHGFYLIDVEDTLYALERGWRYRGGY